MLSPNYLDTFPDPILSLYRDYEDSIIRDIARRISKLDMTSSAAWQMQRITESGLTYENALKELSLLTGKSETELQVMFAKAGVQAMKFDDAIYRAAGLNPLPLNLSPAMIDVLKAGLIKTNGLMQNLTRTTAITGQQAFNDAADLCYMQVSTGSMGYDQAIKLAVKKVANQGVTVIDFSGRRDQLDVATRRAVLTGVSQTTGKMQEVRADEMQSDLVQTSAHAGARPTHRVWQGRIFSRSGQSIHYPDFVETTGYGTVTGLCGVNCRHSFYPFFEGISQNAYDAATLDEMNDKTVKYQGKEIPMYDATQIQRNLERRIRYFKRQASALDAAGLDSTAETVQVRAYQAEMRSFIRQTGFNRQPVRERIQHAIQSE